MCELFLWITRKVLLLVMHFKVFQTIKKKTEKYGLIKAVNYITIFYNIAKGNDIEIYSTDNEEKSVVAERFVRTLKNKVY